ncbi:substrate-binding periplasmic protein [Inhella proteolytica]|uniref:Transporter substrate-binding domain-containing protein n=1 Tax=Inhella proteolytica TaxID=2795029 RepID=A0A931JB00_9BURK|nr:transporter substrate-binding domain-containing protein [Inhella proteolytica]MBH9579300.1 transporter substrate-binding domain-containing protein [Inhella proteolytica]
MRRRLLSLFLTLLACGPAQAQTAAAPVRLCDDVNEWPPYTYFRRVDGQRSGELTGYTVELLRLIGQRRGLELRIEMLPWKRCVEAVRHGEILGFLNAIVTPERKVDFLISDLLYETRLLALWSRQQHPNGLRVNSQADLATLRIGGVHGYSYSQLSEAEQARLQRAPHYESLVQMLHRGRVDVALVNEGVMLGHAALGSPAFAASASLGQVALQDRQPSRFHLMFTRAKPEGARLQALVNEELAALQRSGELAKLRAQFLSPAP